MYITPAYLLLIAVSLVLGLGAQSWIHTTFKKWSKIPVAAGVTGAQAARRMLDLNGLHNVPIYMQDGGEMSDYYDPKANSLHLSRQSYEGQSVADVAIACHEAGHAVQHAQNYAFSGLRLAMFPLVALGSQGWMIAFFLGVIINSTGLVTLGIILFGLVVLYQLVTLPVEFDASSRAIKAIETGFGLPQDQNRGAKKMLTAAAFTYIAAALTSILQLLYLMALNRN